MTRPRLTTVSLALKDTNEWHDACGAHRDIGCFKCGGHNLQIAYRAMVYRCTDCRSKFTFETVFANERASNEKQTCE